MAHLFEQDTYGVEYVFLYGNQSDTSDIDLLVVTKRQTPWEYFCLGRLDLACMPSETFHNLRRKLDPVVIEPMFTGELLIGDKKSVESMRDESATEPPAKEVMDHLLHRAVDEYMKAVSLLRRYRHTGLKADLLWCMNNLGFAFSYGYLSRYYSGGIWHGPVVLARIQVGVGLAVGDMS